LFRLSLNYVSFALAASIRVMLLRRACDVVLVYQLSPVTMALPALLYGKLTGKRVLLYCLDLWPESITASGIGHSSLLFRMLLSVCRWIYGKADRILVTSRLFTYYLRDVIGLDSERIGYLPQYAEELYTLPPIEEAQPAGAGDGGTVELMFAGNIGRMQSVETIIFAAAELKEMRSIRWHIVGDGVMRKRCEELANKLGLCGRVIFYGQRSISEMPAFFSGASALLVTLKNNDFISYTLPGKVQSYMAAGKPVICAANGETPKVVEAAGCGLCCPAEDYKSLARIERQFASEPEKQREYALRSKDYYKAHFRKEAFIESLLHELKLMQQV
jgi:glycosyltransferase involved in cell wall biosynthesis